MILESLVTTISPTGLINVAPMGPVTNQRLDRFTLRPFRPSTTHDNLKHSRSAVIHVSDDVTIFARAVMGRLSPPPPTFPILDGRCAVLKDCCRYFAVEIEDWIEDSLRPTLHCRIIACGEVRPFFGFNRAKHAVIESAILATRTHLIPAQAIDAQLAQLQSQVDKTACPEDAQAFAELKAYIAKKLRDTLNKQL